MKTPVFTGSGVAIVTPFTDDNIINYDKLGELIDWQIQSGTSAIIVCGTTGEASTLSDEEHCACIKFAVGHTDGRVPVIAGTGSNDTAYALWLSRCAYESGADAILVVTPYYNKTTQHGLVRHFTEIADAVDLPMIVYNVPSRTGMTILPETYAELARHPRIIGTKEAGGNFSHIAQTVSLCPKDFYIWSGNDDQVIPILSLGGQGVISVAANIAPVLMADMCRFALSGDFKTAARLQTDYYDLCNDLFIEVNPVPIKTAMNLIGHNVGGLRGPLYDMSEKNLAVLRATLEKSKLL